MRNSNWIRTLALAGILSMGVWPGVAWSITIGFAPGSQNLEAGGTSSVDIVISDLAGEIVSAYDLDVLYDPSVISVTRVSFGSLLGDPAAFEVFNDSDLSTAGTADLAQLSLLSDASLAALQPDAFTLATLEFSAVADGSSALSFRFDEFNDIKGAGAVVLDVASAPGSVDVGRDVDAAVPEPGGATVFAVGLAVIWAARRRRRV